MSTADEDIAEMKELVELRKAKKYFSECLQQWGGATKFRRQLAKESTSVEDWVTQLAEAWPRSGLPPRIGEPAEKAMKSPEFLAFVKKTLGVEK